MGLGSAGGQGEGVHLSLEDLTPDQIQGLGMEELKAFLQEQLRNAYDLKEGQIEQQRPGLMREAERFFILQQIDTLVNISSPAMVPCVNRWGCVATARRIPNRIQNEGYDMFLEMMTNMRRNVIYSMFMFQPSRPASGPKASASAGFLAETPGSPGL